MTNGVKMAENANFVLFVSVIGAEWLISLNITGFYLLSNDVTGRACTFLSSFKQSQKVCHAFFLLLFTGCLQGIYGLCRYFWLCQCRMLYCIGVNVFIVNE